MMYYCHICNARMMDTVFVCNEHNRDLKTIDAFRYVLTHVGGHFGPRSTPYEPAIDLSMFGISFDHDLMMDRGL